MIDNPIGFFLPYNGFEDTKMKKVCNTLYYLFDNLVESGFTEEQAVTIISVLGGMK